MPATVIGVDPHKRSHTAVVLDDCEQIASETAGCSPTTRRERPGMHKRGRAKGRVTGFNLNTGP